MCSFPPAKKNVHLSDSLETIFGYFLFNLRCLGEIKMIAKPWLRSTAVAHWACDNLQSINTDLCGLAKFLIVPH